MQHVVARSIVTLLVSILVLGCAREAVTVGPEPLIPDSPDGTVRAVAKHLVEHDPGILWEALPESYRSDINELTVSFAAKMEPELYNRSMELARHAVEVLQDKQSIILGSSLVASSGVDAGELDRGMSSGLAAAHALLSSEISNLSGLAAVDWQGFLSATGGQIMRIADGAGSDAEADESSLAMLRDITVEHLTTTDDTAVLRITAGDKPPEEVELTRVEGRWVPTELAQEWQEKVAEARARLEELTPERIAELKPQAMFGLAMAEAFVEQIAAIQSPEEFDAAIAPMFEAVMGSFASATPAAEAQEPVPAEE